MHTKDRRGEYHSYDGKSARVYWRGGGVISEWYKHGKIHREGDLPAAEGPRGHKEWWIDGRLHREGNGPAVIRSTGVCSWYEKGLHFSTA